MHNCTYLLLGKCCLFRVNILFFVSKRAKVWFAHFLSELLTVALLLWATWANRSSCSFVKSYGSESLKFLFKKDRMSEEQWEWFALGHKKGENCQYPTKNMNFFQQFTCFCERFTQITIESLTLLFFKEQITYGCSFVKSDVSDWAKREWAKEQIPNLDLRPTADYSGPNVQFTVCDFFIINHFSTI